MKTFTALKLELNELFNNPDPVHPLSGPGGKVYSPPNPNKPFGAVDRIGASALAKSKEMKSVVEPPKNPMKMDDPSSSYTKTSGGIVKFPAEPKPATPISPSSKPDFKDPMALTNLGSQKPPLADLSKKPISFDKLTTTPSAPKVSSPKPSSKPPEVAQQTGVTARAVAGPKGTEFQNAPRGKTFDKEPQSASKQSSYSDFMKDLKASAEKMRSTTSDMASKTGAMKQAASNLSGSFNGDLSSKVSKPVTPGGMSSSDVSKKASSIGVSEFKPGSIAAKFPDTAKFPNTGTFKKVSDLNPTGI